MLIEDNRVWKIIRGLHMYEKSLKGCLIYILKKIFTFQNTIKQSCLDTTNCGIERKMEQDGKKKTSPSYFYFLF